MRPNKPLQPTSGGNDLMAYPIENKLVVAVASSALFDLSDSDKVFKRKGVDAYRKYQREKEDVKLQPGVAFPLIRRLLRLNDGLTESEAPVEVVLLSRNDPDTGLRVLNSIEKHDLPMSRAIFVSGRSPFRYMNALNASLFLSANVSDVRKAVEAGLPAGRVFPTSFADDPDDAELRVAFDFDGVIADDSSEAVYKKKGLHAFQAAEIRKALAPLKEGPLARFFKEISKLQKFEREKRKKDPKYKPRLRTAIITARSAPAHKRVVSTLRKWGIEVDEVFFLGGIAKSRAMEEFKPHIFFDDQKQHIEGVAGATPSAHVPFGVANEPSPDLTQGSHSEPEWLKRRRAPQAALSDKRLPSAKVRRRSKSRAVKPSRLKRRR
jgi:5'-nucleotidase